MAAMMRTATLLALCALCTEAFSPSLLATPQILKGLVRGRLSSSRRGSNGPAMQAGRAGEKVPVILCPAQFGTPEDYVELVELLDQRDFQLYCAPLSRAEWLRIVPSTLTKEFFTANLEPSKTLGFFYEAIDKALASAAADHGEGCQVAFLGHSIGGWVARSYIGERLENPDQRVRSLVTLGTPNNGPPKDSPVAALDQTRGLLTYINERFPGGAPVAGRVACVVGSGTTVPESLWALFSNMSEKVWDDKVGRSLLIEELVAMSSYLPLCGSAFGVSGDGLIPVETALMPDCKSLILEDCNHAAFIPTPGPSVRLPDTYLWYGSPALVDQWVPFL